MKTSSVLKKNSLFIVVLSSLLTLSSSLYAEAKLNTKDKAAPAKPKPARTWTGTSYIIPSWSIAMPMSDAYDFTPAFSFGGMSGELRLRVHPRFSAGVQVDWHRFKDERNGTATAEDTTVTSPQNRVLDLVPILATGHFYFVKRRTLMPWLGLGAGICGSKRSTTQYLPPSSVLETGTAYWQFSYSAQAGLMVFMKRLPLSLGLAFHHAPPTKDIPSVMMTTFNFGLGIPL